MDAVILNTGLAVRIESKKKKYTLANRQYSIYGFANEFSFKYMNETAVIYKYFSKSDFKEEHKELLGVLAGYYSKEKFLAYKEYTNVVDYKSLTTTFKLDLTRLETAQSGDILEITEIVYTDPYNSFYKERYTKFKILEKTYFLNSDRRIEIPKTEVGEYYSKTEDKNYNLGLAETSSKFFFKNLSPAIISDTSVTRFAEILTLIGIKIYWIKKNIFPLLRTASPSPVNDLLDHLINQWENTVVLPAEPDYAEFLLYFNAVSQFYNSLYFRLNTLPQATVEEKTLMLLKVLPLSVLNSSLVSLDIKKAALKQLALQKELNNTEEEFALKIINSIDITNQAQVNEFLGFLIDEKFPTNNDTAPYQKSIYILLYDKIDNYSTIVKMIPELIGNEEFSKDNKTRFVYAILSLWTESKYNPYKNLDSSGNPDYTLIDNGTYEYDENLSKFALLNYESKKNRFKIYEDEYTFNFAMYGEGIYLIKNGNWGELSAGNVMHTYQPITLVVYPSEMDVSIQLPEKDDELNGVIPLFFLMYVDQHGDAKDFDTKVGILFDVVTTITGIGNLLKFRHLRHLSKFGQVLLIIEGVQITASALSLILAYVESCNDSPFCKKLKTVLFFIEITSLVTDPIAAKKARKAAREVVEEGVENGWPSGMLEEVIENGVPVTPKQKIEEIANIDIVEYLAKFRSKAKNRLLEKIKADPGSFTLIYKTNPLIPPGDEVGALITIASGKGLSSDDIAGIIHQACRNRTPPYKANISELSIRMDNIILVRQRGYPFPFNSKADFDDYVNTKIRPFAEMFDLPMSNIRYGGSGITSSTSLSPGIQDTDWWFFFRNKQEEVDFVKKLEERYLGYVEAGLMKKSKANEKIKRMYARYNGQDGKKGYLSAEYITAVYNGKVVDLRKKEKQGSGFIEEYFGGTPSDISLKTKGDNEPIPYIDITHEF